MEHSGTTLISELCRNTPGLYSGFECGVLLGDSPRAFPQIQPFARNIIGGWGITNAQLDQCCDTDSFDAFYDRLFQASTILPDDTVEIFDKTPRYLSMLTTVMDRCPQPVVVCHKDPRSIVSLDFKRRADPSQDFESWYAPYRKPKKRYMTTSYGQYQAGLAQDRVFAVGLENLALNTRQTITEMFDFLGLEFDLRYTIMRNVKYGNNVSGRAVTADVVFEYVDVLTPAQLDRILNDFGDLTDWIYT